MTIMTTQIRQIGPGDLDSVMSIQAECYSDIPLESGEVLSAKIQLFPSGCYLAECGHLPVGYVLSHPWRCDSPPRLGQLVGAVPLGADCIHIHDLAVASSARGCGIARKLLSSAFDAARSRHMRKVTLISVQSSVDFWRRHGFIEIETNPDVCDILKTYQRAARYMGLNL